MTAAAVVCATLFTVPHPALAGGPAPAGPAASLEWRPCAGADGFDCATAKVPLDYRSPQGRTIELAVIRRKAAGPGRRIGTVFFNPGGPGTPGVPQLPALYGQFPDEVRERFDVVTWDPRGVGQSTAVRCFATAEEARTWKSRIPAGFPVGQQQRQTWITAYAELGRRCERRDPELLRHVSTADTARDLDWLREAVGDRQLNYLGVSYGTFLGAAYANLFPGRVRAMVLDGVVDPRRWMNSSAEHAPRLGTWLRNSSDLGSAATLEQFLSLCGRATAAGCAFSAGTPQATRTKFGQLLRLLRQQPQGSWTYGNTVSDLVNGLYITSQWSSLAQILQDLWQRRTPAVAGTPDGAYPGFEQAQAVFCSESPNPRDPGSYVQQEQASVARSGDTGRHWTWINEACATWPAKAAAPYRGPWDRPTARPVLVVGTVYDPATPYSNAQALPGVLANARLLTLNGYGHTALLNPSRCVNEREGRYFVDGVLPEEGTVCAQDTRPFTAPKPAGGIATGGGGLAGAARP
ncbi:alpha/beta hydrolase [Streptomyces sp. NPDC001774]